MNKRDFLKTAGAVSLAALLDSPGFAARSPAELAQDEAFWAEIRTHFPTDNRFINLENGFYCFQPKDVFDAFVANAGAINGEASHYMRTKLDTDVVKMRTAVAALAGVPVEELVITRNTTESLDTIINGIPWQAGDQAVMATQDYGSMMDMFALQARRHGIVNHIVQLPLDPASDAEIIAIYRKAITPKTKLLMVSHIVGGTGQVLPVAAICDMAHGLGVPVMVDGAHSFAHLDFKIPDLHCDYFGTSLHKWLSAPLGLGMLWVKRARIPGLWQMFGDAGMPDDDIRKLNHRGTHPIHSDLTLPRAIAFHQAIGSERKMARLRFLQHSWTNRARAIPGVYLNTPHAPERTCAIANVGVRGVAPAALAEMLLKDHNIYTVAIDRGEVQGVRVTPQIYTAPAELDALVVALTKIAGRA
ncbi:penicillin epimerase [Sphingomonas panacis]|uniref:Penicillin epimerase n=1 Tax=Sphingomonas panacis TaxID=1560345 RepID=A0A1B3ZBD7_9SPHN|nr:aminotransferase class V-fold PLP-dependent enzyme [Sphingomonas panacis]AOH84744.1 penicillin epimerase [Sphingomonas panacis]